MKKAGTILLPSWESTLSKQQMLDIIACVRRRA
jgi:hypothetical protein